MVHQYNAKATKKYFEDLAEGYFSAHAPRDEIFLELILPKYIHPIKFREAEILPSEKLFNRSKKNKGKITALDFGCGGGALLLEILKRGVKAKGIEKHSELWKMAQNRLHEAGFNKEDVIRGSIKELDNLPKNSFDFAILMGVLQYLSPKQRSQLYMKIHRILKPKGHMVATFQNAFFDLFTFNKYTVDFFKEKIFKPLKLDKLIGSEIVKDLKSLMTYPDEPDYSVKIARDNIYVETTNPLTIGDELANHKFKLLQKYFYTFFPLPRLIESKYKNKLEKFNKQFELKRSQEWYGHLMANAFLVDCIKEK